MKKKIAIFGSTGSIGKSLIEIIKHDKNNFEIILLTANKNYSKLLNQAKIYKVKKIVEVQRATVRNFLLKKGLL